LASALLPAPARAQEEMTTPGTRPSRNMEGPLIARAREIVSGLNLSDEQKRKVDEVLKNAAAEGRELMGEMEDVSPLDRMERMRERFTDVREQVAAVLNDEQKKAFREKIEAYRRELAGAAPGQNLRPGQLVDRLRENLAKLDLTPEQKTKVDAAIEDVRGTMKELREAVQAGDEMAREKLGVAIQDARTEITAILTPAQREKLRGMMQSAPGERPQMGPDMMEGDGPMRRRDARRGRQDQRPASRPAAGADALKPGMRAPDFALKRLDGQVVRLASFEGQPLVIVFGSYSSPSFRQRAAALEQLKREFGQRATFLVVYTKEAHPKGEWEVERNRDEEIAIEPHKDLDGREAMAQKAKDALKITVPIVLDTMDDAAATAYGLAHNGAVVIGRDLKVVVRQQWFDPYTLRRHLEALGKPTTRPAAAASTD
jgi:hypothetical protein